MREGNRLDNFPNLLPDQAAITLIRWGNSCGSLRDEHAMIAIEENISGECVRTLIDLSAPSSKSLPYALSDLPLNLASSTRCISVRTKRPIIRASINIREGVGEIRYHAKSDSWIVPVAHSRHMLEQVRKMEERLRQHWNSIRFNLFGKHNLFNCISGMLGAQIHSCITWALETLQLAGINLRGNLGINLFTKTSGLLQIQAKRPGADELYAFAEHDKADTIRLFYPSNTNVNYIREGAHLGSAASYYGHYSPLMIAVSYGSFETVKMLVEEYHADVNLLGGRARDHAALDCASQKRWFIGRPNLQEELKTIRAYLLAQNAISGSELKPAIQGLVRAAYRGDNKYIEETLQDRRISINQTVPDATGGFWAMHLGIYSPLMAAVAGRKLETVRALVRDHRADVNLLNGRDLDLTVYDYAIYYRYPEIISYLASEGALTGAQVKESLSISELVPFVNSGNEMFSTEGIDQTFGYDMISHS